MVSTHSQKIKRYKIITPLRYKDLFPSWVIVHYISLLELLVGLLELWKLGNKKVTSVSLITPVYL